MKSKNTLKQDARPWLVKLQDSLTEAHRVMAECQTTLHPFRSEMIAGQHKRIAMIEARISDEKNRLAKLHLMAA